MGISANINTYIQNSKIRGQLCRWTKSIVNVYVAPILSNIQRKDFMISQVTLAMNSWNNFLRQNNIPVQFQGINSPIGADIVVHWVKVGRVYEGMCKYLSVTGGVINKIAIDVGLENEFSGKNTTDLSVYCAIMHEFGHSLGLGHGVEVDDIMFVPHRKNIQVPSENDIYVLKEIYK